MKKIRRKVALSVSLAVVFLVPLSANQGHSEEENIEHTSEVSGKLDFTYTAFGEFGTATWCTFCKYAHGALKNIYAGKFLPTYCS